MKLHHAFHLLLTVFSLVGCNRAGKIQCLGQSPFTASIAGIRKFESDQALASYLKCEANQRNLSESSDQKFNSSPIESQNENITNNQESGVDEGGIVKNIGNYLITLRKGRLYVVSVAAAGNPVQTDSVRVASEEALNEGVWYDELLVKGDLIYVIGFRFSMPSDLLLSGAAEIQSFRLALGKLNRIQTLYFESNDYYSGRNYASRMVEGKIALYMPHYGLMYSQEKYLPTIPHTLQYGNGKFSRVRALFGGNDVFISSRTVESPTLHTLVLCDLPTSGTLDCRAKSVLGDFEREHYVSATHLFLWGAKTVYALDFQNLTLSSHRLEGKPIDQFSFKQDGDKLHVVTRQALEAGDSIHLHTLLLSQFNAFANQEVRSTMSQTTSSAVRYRVNRFIEDAFVLGGSSDEKGRLLVLPVSGAAASELELPAPVVRIESLTGVGALAVSQQLDPVGHELILNTVQLGSAVRVLSTAVLPGSSQGEWRSHGFFFKASAQGGVLGLPTVQSSLDPYAALSGSANIDFLAVSAAGQLTGLGQVVSTSDSAGACETSCIDWYGNTRPIFIGGRIFALMGSELQEVSIQTGVVQALGSRLKF